MKYQSAGEKENKNSSNDFKKALSTALRYLTYRYRSRQEILEHLNKKQFDKETIEKTLSYLSQLDYVNDQKFALNWGKSLAKNKRVGKHRLLRELTHKGISDSAAKHATRKIFSEFNEWELAKTCAEKKVSSLEKHDIYAKRRKLAGYLERKGFPTSMILKALNLFAPLNRS